jgi:hypothetical protein
MANKLSKTRPADEPYAIFESNGGGIKWHILKTYKTPASEKKDPFARWFVAAYSDATGSRGDMGDDYAVNIRRYGRCTWASEAWIEQYGLFSMV